MDSYVAALATPERPGALIALGVVSLIVAVLSLLASGFTTFFWWTGFRGSLPPAPPPAPPPLAAVSLPHYSGETMSPHGLPRAQCSALIARIALTGPFADDRREMIDRLLAEYGHDILSPTGDFPLTAVPTPRNRDPRAAPWASDSFQAPSGILIVDNASARIERPRTAGGTLSVVREKTVDLNNHQRFQTAALDRHLPMLRAHYPALTQGQIDFIAFQYAKSNANAEAFSESFPVTVSAIDNQGVARVAIHRIEYWILPDGRSVTVKSTPQGLDGATGRPLPPLVRNFRPALPGNPWWALANAMHSAAGLLLACFLVAAAIRTFVNAPAGARALLRFATLKSLLVVIEIVVCIGFFASITDAPTPVRMSSGTYDTSKGVTGLILSVIFQSIFIVAIFVTLCSPSVRAYLNANGRIYLFSPEYRQAFARIRSKPRVRVSLRAASVLVLLLAIAHFASLFIWRGDTMAHVSLTLLCALVALLCFKWSSTPWPASVPTLPVLLMLIALVACQTTPALAQVSRTDRKPAPQATSQPAKSAEITALLKQIHQFSSPNHASALAKLASMGGPAVPQVLDYLKQIHFANDDDLQTIVTAWKKSGLLSSDSEAYNLALRALPDLFRNTNGRRAVTFLSAFPPKPDIAPFYARFAADYQDEVRQAIAQRSLEIDKAATLLKQAGVMLGQRPSPNERNNLCDTLHRVGPLALPFLAKMVRSANTDEAITALAAMTPGGLKDPQRMKRFNDMHARDNLGHPVGAPTATLQKLNDPDLPSDCVAPVVGAIVNASNSIRRSNYSGARAEEILCRQAAYTLAHGGTAGRDALVNIIAGRSVGGSTVSAPTRAVIMRELASAFPALEGVASEVRGPVADSRWPSIAAAVRAVIGDPEHAPATLAIMLASKNPADVRAAADVLANIGITDPVQIDPALSALRLTDRDVHQLLASALFKGTLTENPKVEVIARALILRPSDPQAQTQLLTRLASAGPAGQRALAHSLDDPLATGPVLARILTALGRNNPAAQGLLRASGSFDDANFRHAAMNLLLAYVDHPTDAITTHLLLLNDSDPVKQQVAAHALRTLSERSEIGPVTQAKIQSILQLPEPRENRALAATATVVESTPLKPSGAPAYLWPTTWSLLGLLACFLLTLSVVSKPPPPLEADVLD
jgi:hypothetical protein